MARKYADGTYYLNSDDIRRLEEMDCVGTLDSRLAKIRSDRKAERVRQVKENAECIRVFTTQNKAGETIEFTWVPTPAECENLFGVKQYERTV